MSDTESKVCTKAASIGGSLDSLTDIINNLSSDEEGRDDCHSSGSSKSLETFKSCSRGSGEKDGEIQAGGRENVNILDEENEFGNSCESGLPKNGAKELVAECVSPTDEFKHAVECFSDEESVELRERKVVEIHGVTEDETADDEMTQKMLARRRGSESGFNDDSSVIGHFLGHCSDDAEARLLARRQARAEAREIRMRELERQQKEQEENADRQYDMLEATSRAARTSGSKFLSSRRSSEDSLEDGGSIREIRHELKEVEEKFRKAMIANAQLDNDKSSQTYQLELLKDRLEELEEEHSQLRREHRDKCREHDQLKRLSARLKDDLAVTQAELQDRDQLILEKGLVIVVEEVPPDDEDGAGDVSKISITTPKKALVSIENAQLLEASGEGSLDVRLARFASERKDFQDQISHLRLELEDERSKRRKSSGVMSNGPTSDPDYDADDVQRDVVRQLADYKFRSQKAEQDVATLQATVARLESQVIRYKSASEMSEKSEEALKQEKRKLQREARDAQNRAEELETSNTHLLKRLDKLKNAKSTLLKEL